MDSTTESRSTANASRERTPRSRLPSRYRIGSSNQPRPSGSYERSPFGNACCNAPSVTGFNSQRRVLLVRSSAVAPLMRSRVSSPRENGFTILSNGCQVIASARASDPTQSTVNSSAPISRHHSTRRHDSSGVKSAGARYRFIKLKLGQRPSVGHGMRGDR